MNELSEVFFSFCRSLSHLLLWNFMCHRPSRGTRALVGWPWCDGIPGVELLPCLRSNTPVMPEMLDKVSAKIGNILAIKKLPLFILLYSPFISSV